MDTGTLNQTGHFSNSPGLSQNVVFNRLNHVSGNVFLSNYHDKDNDANGFIFFDIGTDTLDIYTQSDHHADSWYVSDVAIDSS